jgi:uncharacterized protein (TIGR03435 family)
MTRKLLLVSMMILAVYSAQAQQGSTARHFDVASIKLSSPDALGVTMQFQPGGRFSATGITTWNLILLAFGVRPYEIDATAAPRWLSSNRFDIVAKAEGLQDLKGAEVHDQMMQRVRGLLSDRFGLITHRTIVQRNGLALIRVKDGSKLQPASEGGGCNATADGPGQMITMDRFALTLSLRFDEPVVDQTGLRGNFCIWLRFSADDGTPQGLGLGWGPNTDLSRQVAGPSLPTALQEQLGLQVKSQKVPVQMLIIDHIAMPSPN